MTPPITMETAVLMLRTKENVAVAEPMSRGLIFDWSAMSGAWKLGPVPIPRDGLEEDDLRPGRGAREVNVETETNGHEDEAEEDRGDVKAGFADEDTGCDGEDGQCYAGWEDVDAAEDG